MEQVFFNPLQAYFGGRSAQAQIGQQQAQQIAALQQLQAAQAQAQAQAQQSAQIQMLGQAFMAGDMQAGNALAALDPAYAMKLKEFTAGPEALAPTKEERLVAALGLTPGTPEYYKKLEEVIGKAGGGVNVNVGLGGMQGGQVGTSLDTAEMAKLNARRADAFVTATDQAAMDASEVATGLGDAVALLKSGKVQTGALADARLAFKQFGQSIGLPADTAAEERVIEIFNALALAQKKPGSGATSDKDMDFYKQSVANIGKSVDGNLMGIVAQATSAREKQQKAQALNRWIANGQNPLLFQAWWDENKKPAIEVAKEVAVEFGLDPAKYVPQMRRVKKSDGTEPLQPVAPATSYRLVE